MGFAKNIYCFVCIEDQAYRLAAKEHRLYSAR